MQCLIIRYPLPLSFQADIPSKASASLSSRTSQRQRNCSTCTPTRPSQQSSSQKGSFMRASYLSCFICVVFSIDTLQCGSSLEAILVVAGVGVDNIGAFVGSCEFCSTHWRSLAENYRYEDGNEPDCELHGEDK